MDLEPRQDFYIIGDWRVVPDLNQLQRGDEVVQLEPKVMAVLGVLASKPGEVFSRQELEDTVWHDMVVGYDALSKAINKLREALQDDKKNPRYIQTLSKKGYRLVTAVSHEPPAQDSDPAHEDVAVNKQRTPSAWWMIAALLLVVGLLVVASNWNTNKPPEQSTPAPSQKQMDEKPTIVILPFQNIGQSKNDDYLADTMGRTLRSTTDRLVCCTGRGNQEDPAKPVSHTHERGKEATVQPVYG